MSGEFRVGQVAAAAGVNIETLRYYERRGCSPGRTAAWAATGCTRPRRSPGCG